MRMVMPYRRFVAAICLLTTTSLVSSTEAQQSREWTDSSGKFSVTATLVQVRDGVAFLKSDEGKTFKIPVTRLSDADQEHLKVGTNPFEMVDEKRKPTPKAPSGFGKRSGTMFDGWRNPPTIDWDSVDTIDLGFGETQWTYTPPASNKLPFEPKRSSLPKKSNFFEGMRRMKINPISARCVAGYTLTFSVPKPLSRISLVDLPSGKAINCEPVECNMCPLTVLNDGKTVLMQGTAREREGFETGDQLQLWQLNGKKVARSGIWIPFKDDKKAFGKVANGVPLKATAIANNHILLLSDTGHLACFDLTNLRPIWHSRLSRNSEITMTVDRKQLLVLDETTLMQIDPQTGKAKCTMQLEGQPRLGWTKMKLDDAGEKLLLSYINHLRVIDLRTGETVSEYAGEGTSPISPNGLSFPTPDYALLNNNLLFHIPSRIKVCEYKDAAVIESMGGTEFIGLLTDSGGLIMPALIPHAAAEKVLAQAVDDPSVFLIHPGVEVSVDVSKVPGTYQAEVKKGLESAINRAGYKLSENAAIKIKAAISGPKQEAVSYIARGSYIANVYKATIKMEWQGKDIWSRSGGNIPMMLTTKSGQTIQQRLDELGKRPNTEFFEKTSLPKMLQTPTQASGGNQHNALLVSKFTLRGLVDSN